MTNPKEQIKFDEENQIQPEQKAVKSLDNFTEEKIDGENVKGGLGVVLKGYDQIGGGSSETTNTNES